jgi:hypothetical protein
MMQVFPSRRKTGEFRAVFPFRRLVFRETSRVLIAILAVLLLFAPIIGLNAVQKTLSKFFIVFVSSSVFIVSVTIFSNGGLGEVFAAGAAYSAVLVVFVSGNGVQSG